MLIYKITNTVNDRVYVGLTTGPLRVRWRQHLSAAKTDVDKPLYRAMRKHGAEKFAIKAIYEATSIEDLRAAEIRLIGELKAHAKDGGYNLTDHGLKHGNFEQSAGEDRYNAKLTEEMVAFIRDPAHWDKPNSAVLEMVQERFGAGVTRDTLRDARRGDAWKYLNDKYPPVKVGQGTRKQPMTEERKAQAKRILDAHRAEALNKLAESKRGKRGSNAKLSEQTVKDIFYCPLSLLKTAAKFGVSKKMVLLIKQRKAHVYLTKGL
jgi:group I intron endonuclease